MITLPDNSKVLWLDDDPKMIEKSVPLLEQGFKKIDRAKPNFERYEYYENLLKSIKNNRDKNYIIFLDINLGSDKNGIYVYEQIRQIDEEIVIVFVSANLYKHEEKINEFQEKDKNLFTLEIPFPKTNEELLKKIMNRPIEQLYEVSLDSFRNFGVSEQVRFYNHVNEINERNKAYVQQRFIEEGNPQFIIMDEPIKIIKKGSNDVPLNSSILTKLCLSYDKLLFGFNRKNGNDFELVKIDTEKLNTPKSTDHIPAQILEVEEKHVLLNCLLDPEERQFQVRRFDLEPIEEAVTLEKNQLIIVEIKTYVGKRIFSFKDNKDPKWEPYFERKMYFQNTEDYSDVLNPPKDEDNF